MLYSPKTHSWMCGISCYCYSPGMITVHLYFRGWGLFLTIDSTWIGKYSLLTEIGGLG